MQRYLATPQRLTILAAGLFAFLAWPAMAGDRALVRTADDSAIEWGPCPEFFPASCRIGVLHGDPAKPNADIFFKVPPETTVPAHTHTSAERMVLVSGRMEIDYEGQDPVVLEPGTYAWGPPEHPHSARCLDAGDCVLFIAFEEPIDAMPAGDQ